MAGKKCFNCKSYKKCIWRVLNALFILKKTSWHNICLFYIVVILVSSKYRSVRVDESKKAKKKSI